MLTVTLIHFHQRTKLDNIVSLIQIYSERMFPMLGESRTWGHSLRIRGKTFRTEVRENFFAQSVVNVWNSLPQKVVQAKTLCDFKKKLDFALRAKGIKGYEGGGGIRILISMISHGQNEWRSRLEGPNGLL